MLPVDGCAAVAVLQCSAVQCRDREGPDVARCREGGVELYGSLLVTAVSAVPALVGAIR